MRYHQSQKKGKKTTIQKRENDQKKKKMKQRLQKSKDIPTLATKRRKRKKHIKGVTLSHVSKNAPNETEKKRKMTIFYANPFQE
jgi:hypothetical protein